jgi:hypothetical protein
MSPHHKGFQFSNILTKVTCKFTWESTTEYWNPKDNKEGYIISAIQIYVWHKRGDRLSSWQSVILTTLIMDF